GTDRFKKEFGLFAYADGSGSVQDNQSLRIRPEASVREWRVGKLPEVNDAVKSQYPKIWQEVLAALKIDTRRGGHGRHGTGENIAKRVYAESGWDHTLTRFGDHPQDYLPVDLNSLLYGYAEILGQIFQEVEKPDEAQYFLNEKYQIGLSMNKWMFDPKSYLYLDYNMKDKKISSTVTAASFFAFEAELYPKSSTAELLNSQKILHQLIRHLKPGLPKDFNKAKTFLRQSIKNPDPKRFIGMMTTDHEGTGQWDGSWTWAPLVEMAFQALMKYQMPEHAAWLTVDWCEMVIVQFELTGVFWEKYWGQDGSIEIPKGSEIYGNEEGFGWTNGTLNVFLKYLSETKLEGQSLLDILNDRLQRRVELHKRHLAR
ncbi:MAG: hypothetical protein KDD22_01315, partial [Bdellovibrionales bacterium]|nr:hypothetical protein [Bdellovibrionales bacterium]